MNRISNLQLFSILISVKAFSLICSGITADAGQMAGAAIAIVLQFILALPMLSLYSKNGFDQKKEMLFGRLGMTFYALFFIMWGAVSFNRLWGVSKSVYFPVESSLMCSVIIAAVCLYCSSLGFNALSRSSLIMAGIFIFSVGVLILGAYSKADTANYVPSAAVRTVLENAVSYFCSSGEPVMLFILLNSSRSDRSKGVTAFFAGALILTELIYLIEITVLGKIINISDFPFFTAGAFSQPFSIQRADSLYMITFTLLCVMTVTLQLILAAMLVKEIIPELKYNTLLSVILMLSISAFLNYSGINIFPLIGILIIILSAVIPVIMLIRRIYNEKKTCGGNNDASAVRMQSQN